jgi:hypothetical protein
LCCDRYDQSETERDRKAETIQIVGRDQKTVDATVISHDRNTGFGLLWATTPLQVTPIPLGKAGVDLPPSILQGFHIRDIVIH